MARMQTYHAWAKIDDGQGWTWQHWDVTGFGFHDAVKRRFKHDELFDSARMTYWGCPIRQGKSPETFNRRRARLTPL